MNKLTARQTARVMKVLGQRYSRTVTLSWTRAEYNAKIAEIAKELY